jgi:uncharacterized repeat protein (TIGR01451 family)
MRGRYISLLFAAVVLAVFGLSVPLSASALTPAPGWGIVTRAAPTNLAPGGGGKLTVYVYNTGAATGEDPVITDTLPVGTTATSASFVVSSLVAEEGTGGIGGGACTVAGSRVVSCTAESVPPGGVVEVHIAVSVAAGVPSGSEAENGVTVSGGGALSPASDTSPIKFNSAPSGFGFSSFDAWFTNADGTTDTQAGSHPYELTVVYAVNSKGIGSFQEYPTGGEAQSLVVNLPPGLIGNPTAIPRCTRKQFDGEISLSENEVEGYEPSCAPATQVGVDEASANGFPIAFKVYNLVPPPGVAAQFGFDFEGVHIFLDAGVRSGGSTALSSDYGISEHVNPLPRKRAVFNAITIWGIPGEESHTVQRGGIPSGIALTPLLTLPTSCEGPQEISIEAPRTWESETTTARASILTHDSTGTEVGFTGCDHLGFAPSISAAPDTSYADTPAGLTVNVEAPQEGLSSVGGLSTSNLKNTTVTLPEGVVINPGQAPGLQTCPLSQTAVRSAEGPGSEGPPSCPPASKIGTVQITTPLLADKLEGEVYLVQSEPPDVKILIAASGDGVNLKVIGNVALNTMTGQLVTTFTETPEVPFTDFKLSFSGGAQAALATPTGCGVYTTNADFTPWSTPLVLDDFSTSSFAITSGTNGAACAAPLPFSPSLTAGATTDQAGGYTDFSLLLSRGDDQQRIKSLQFKTPKGLLGMISHVTPCGEPQAAQGECPESAQIGHTVVGAGPGPYPLYVPEPGQPPAPIYITGPYEGAPYGLAIVVPVVAGPFNLGKVVVRGRIEVDPQTAQLTVTTDPLPTILDGVPADLRTINSVIERPDFMFNPTNCEAQSFSGTATSVAGTTAGLSSPFQVGSCRSLTFKPGFKVSTSAKTSRLEGARLSVKLTLPDEGGLSSTANVAKVKVSLPKQLPTPLTTLQKACLERVFAANPAGCPVASQVGQVKVSTPVLPGGLSGTAYFVSHGGAKYPELIMVLVGQNGVTVQVHGETFISKAGITTATFAAVPDVPFSSFELLLPKRPYPALTGNGDLCKGSLVMPTEMVAQNGLVIKQNTKIAVTGCPQVKRALHLHKQARAKRKRKGARRR